MGLAASQARFLLLSSRQSDVELRMQSITNQKLALQRQSGDIATKYQRALNSTNLLWNDNSINYNTITNPNAESALQYMVTDSYGAVVLDSNLASRLNCPALPASGSGADFEALYPNQESFLKAISGSSITTEDAQAVIADNKKAQEEEEKINDAYSSGVTVNYKDSDIVIAAGPAIADMYANNRELVLLDTPIAEEVTVGGGMGSDSGSVAIDIQKYQNEIGQACSKFEEYLNLIGGGLKEGYYKTLCYGKDGGGGPMANNAAIIEEACEYAYQATKNQYLYGYYDTDATTTEGQDEMTKMFYRQTTLGGYSLYELRQENYTGDATHADKTKEDVGHDVNTIDFVATSDSTSTSMGDEDTIRATANFKAYSKTIIDTYMNYFDMYMEQNYGSADGVSVGTPNMVEQTQARFAFTDSEKKDKESELTSHYSSEYSTTTAHTEGTGTNATTWYYSVEQSNAAVSTHVNAGLEAWVIDHTNYVFDGYTSTRKGFGGTNSAAMPGTSSIDSTATARAQYYMKLYNALCSSGWVTDAKVNDSKYLENQLMYGNYIVGRMGSFTSYNELSITDSYTPFTLEDDKEAQERAEIEYEAARDSLAYKEALLDAQLDDLTTEREAITTEKESVQALIDENVKKFKLFA